MTGKAITRGALMPRMVTRTRRDVRSVKIQITLKVSSVQPRSFNANLVIWMGNFTSLCYQKKQASFRSRKPKVLFMLVKHQSEDCSSSDESSYLQVKIQQSQAECKKIPTLSCDYQFSIQAKTPSDKKPVSQNKIGHLGRYQHHAS